VRERGLVGREPFDYAVVYKVVAAVNPESAPVAGAPNDVDEELLALPAPPPGRRFATMGLMALVVVVALALVASVRSDLAFFFVRGGALELGDVTHLAAASLTPNTLVTVEGTPLTSGTVRYRRVVTGESYVVFPLAGQRTVFVQMTESAASQPRTTYSGRLVRFADLGGRMASVRDYLATTMDMPVTPETYVLLVDETPASCVWAVALAVLAAIFVLIDVMLIVRWFRPVPRER
jgi:hypothetical protein